MKTCSKERITSSMKWGSMIGDTQSIFAYSQRAHGLLFIRRNAKTWGSRPKMTSSRRDSLLRWCFTKEMTKFASEIKEWGQSLQESSARKSLAATITCAVSTFQTTCSSRTSNPSFRASSPTKDSSPWSWEIISLMDRNTQLISSKSWRITQLWQWLTSAILSST